MTDSLNTADVNSADGHDYEMIVAVNKKLKIWFHCLLDINSSLNNAMRHVFVAITT